MKKYLLTIIQGTDEPYERTIFGDGKDTVSFGRNARNDIVIPFHAVSAFHGCFFIENNLPAVWDFGSKNGIYLNGARVNVSAMLKSGDKLFLCKPSLSPDVLVSIALTIA